MAAYRARLIFHYPIISGPGEETRRRGGKWVKKEKKDRSRVAQWRVWQCKLRESLRQLQNQKNMVCEFPLSSILFHIPS